MLTTGTLAPDRHDKALATIERNALVQAQLIDDVLDVSRIITGKLRLEIGLVDLARVIESALDVVRPAADAKGVTLDQRIDAGIAPLRVDGNRLQQVVWNLLSNAVRFTPSGGRVRVRVRCEAADSTCVIAVEDSGEGIGAEFLPHVFERFRQADGGTTRRHGGLGLGLAIVLLPRERVLVMRRGWASWRG